MSFIPPLILGVGKAVAGIATFLSSGTILAGVAKFGLGLAAQFAIGQILAPKPQAQAMLLQTAYGENLARTVAMGRVGTAGHHIYRNSHGKGGRRIQDVYVLSHFQSRGITRIRWKGNWHTLDTTFDHPDLGYRIAGTGKAFAWVKFYRGTMGQPADLYLQYMSNPAGRWTPAHRLAGVSYAVVNFNLEREDMPQPLEFFVELEGGLFYDWRKDSTVGGTGSQRWDDQSTWEFTTNPVVMMYALERGIYNGTERMVGKGVSPSRLPLAQWTVAANICDEVVNGKRRYEAGLLAVSGQGSTHAANMQPLLDACAGSWVETAAGEYPIVGANQAVVATFTDHDIVPDEPYRFSHKRTRTELVNTAAGSFVNPETFYETAPLAPRIDQQAIAVDGERLAVSIPYTAVNTTEVGDRLLDIAIRASRYQANAEICLPPKFLRINPGRWVRFNSAKHGDRKFVVLQKRLGSVGTNSARNVYLTLQEVGDGIFDPTAYVTVPPDGIVPGAPDYLGEVDNFRVAAVTLQDENGAKRPGAQARWNPIEDPTVTGVALRWRPVAQPDAVFYDQVPNDVTFYQLENGLTANSDWEVSTRLITSPARAVAWSAWTPFRTTDARIGGVDIYDGAIDLAKFGQDARAFQNYMGAGFRDALEEIESLATYSIDQDFRNFADKSSLRRELVLQSGALKATVDERFTVALGPNSAIANKFVELTVEIAGKASASALEAVTIQVEEIDGIVTAQAASIESLKVEVNGKASAEAFEALRLQIDGSGGIAERLSGVEFTMDGVTASSRVRTSAGYTPGTGFAVRFGWEGRISTSANYRAAFYIDVSATTARAVFEVDSFIIASGANLTQPFVFTGGVAYMENARLGTLYFNRLMSNNGKLIIDGSGNNASIEMWT
jgi:hypothetical protein